MEKSGSRNRASARPRKRFKHAAKPARPNPDRPGKIQRPLGPRPRTVNQIPSRARTANERRPGRVPPVRLRGGGAALGSLPRAAPPLMPAVCLALAPSPAAGPRRLGPALSVAASASHAIELWVRSGRGATPPASGYLYDPSAAVGVPRVHITYLPASIRSIGGKLRPATCRCRVPPVCAAASPLRPPRVPASRSRRRLRRLSPCPGCPLPTLPPSDMPISSAYYTMHSIVPASGSIVP